MYRMFFRNEQFLFFKQSTPYTVLNKKRNFTINKKNQHEYLECRTGQASHTTPEFYHYATQTFETSRERFTKFFRLKNDNENYDALVFLSLLDNFAGFFSFSVLLEDLLYLVLWSSKLTKNRTP